MTEGRNKKTTTSTRFKGIEWLFMNLPFVCYLTLLGIVYIFNAHSVEGNLRHIEILKDEVSDSNWRLMDVKQGMMYGSTQSQIQKKVAGMDLKYTDQLPRKIKITQ